MSSTLSIVLVIVFLVAAAAVVVAVAAVVAARRRAAGTPAPAPADPFSDADASALRGDPRALRLGDIVEIRGRSYAVRGTLAFAEGSWTWSEHLLDDGSGSSSAKVWLSVEEDPDLELALWHEVPSATVVPGSPSVDFDGRRYAQDESGRARYTATGTTGLDPTGTMRYQDYVAPDGALLSFESYGDSDRWEVGRGKRVDRAEVQVWAQGPGTRGY